MSREAEALVWKRSRAKGSNLLVLVKIADWATDEGLDAFGSPKALAKWTRMTERALRYILHRLEAAGEITIELNVERRTITIEKRTFAPEWFIHVRCVAEWETYQGESKSAKFSASRFKSGRPKGTKQSAKFSAKPEKISEEPEKFSEKSEKSRTAYKERSGTDPLIDPVSEVQAGAAPRPTPPDAGACPSSPSDNIGVITRLTHDAIELLGPYSDDLPDTVKALCARHHIAYDSLVVQKAVESARWQRGYGRPA